MLKKIEKIKNFAVFDDYKWDAVTVGNDGKPLTFKKINILYGRNYSGKTTLSRILRSLEILQLPDNYDHPQFEIVDESGIKTSQDNIANFSTPVRVFNEDFVKSNLKFLIDPDGEIAPFAILGGNNQTLEKEISKLILEIGENEEIKTGLYKELEDAEMLYFSLNDAYEKASSDLDTSLAKKAIDKKFGIKYRSERFGDVNYNIKKIKSDIQTISQQGYHTPSDKEVSDCEAIIRDTVRSPIDTLRFKAQYKVYKEEAISYLTKEIGVSNKIQRLLHNAALNQWVKNGVELADNATECPFCGNHINDNFWKEIHAHFDEESKELENAIKKFIKQIDEEIKREALDSSISQSQFYAEYVEKYESAKNNLATKKIEYNNALQELIDQLEKRLTNISVPVNFSFTEFSENELEEAYKRLNSIITDNNNYASELDKAKKNAYKIIRLKEVEEYCENINYSETVKRIEDLKAKKNEHEAKLNQIKNALIYKQNVLDAKKRLLNDEEKGARHVNEYLDYYFGHHFVTLEAQKSDEDEKQIKFRIMRNGKPAFNLSEGECSLIAFCYFMAKLDDVSTSGKKPIIWIDDPISSLDSNHIYFVFSLIVAKIAKTGCFDQLFISTHNLDFLKYLNRIKSFRPNSNGKPQEESKAYFMIERIGNNSAIKALPNYLKNNATEYNYLFSQIYNTAQCISVTDENYDMLYSFGNNTRKFLEMYLYFKYPSKEDLLIKLKRFFDPEDVPPILINRLINEDSHGSSLENSLRTDIDPETIPAAKKLLQLLQQDKAQYDAFIDSLK